jgi:glycosyltransferase involved in cell wall biosynthesis
MNLKILHCIHSLHGGGAERQLSILANHLDGTALEFTVFCVDASINDIDNPYCKVVTVQDKKNYPWKMVKEVASAIATYRPDLVHCWLPPSVSVPALIAAKKAGIPVITSYRNKKIFESWIRIPEYFFTLLLANGIASNNPPDQSSYLFRNLFYMKKGIVIPNAVTVDESYYLKRTRSVKRTCVKFLFVGRLTKQKNWQTLLKALAIMGNKREWHLLICGKGEDETAIKRLAINLNIEHKMTMLGYRKDVYDLMVDADVLVLPSWYEGMPNVVLEAMSIGLPVVASRIPSITEIFEEPSGISFFDPSNVNELACRLNGFLEDDIDSNAITIQGRKNIVKFSPDKLLDSYRRYYIEVIG